MVLEDVPDTSGLSIPTPSVAVPEKISELAEDPILQNFKDLQVCVRKVRDEGVSLEDAERLAAQFVDVLIEIAGPNGTIHTAQWEARRTKNAYKTWRSKAYLEIVQGSEKKAEKKPTEAMIDALVTTNENVCKAQDAWDKAEEYALSLHRIYDVFRDAHIYFRGIAKGGFNGG